MKFKPKKSLSIKNKAAMLNAKGRFKMQKARAYKTKAEGKALIRQAKTREAEMTKRTVARSAALSNALSNQAKYNAEARAQSMGWNSIISGEPENKDPNNNTTDNSAESTTNPDRDGR